jgi:glycosyltransferase involved in cell wall biosynthesis
MEIVYFGNDWFAENRTSSHHMARRLAQHCRLLYVEVPGLRSPRRNTRDLRKLVRKLSASLEPPRQIGPQMWHMTLPQVPFRRLPGAAWVNTAWSANRMRAALRTVGFSKPYLWFTVPHAGHVIGRLGETASIYYCIDNYSALPDVDIEQVTLLDDRLTSRADLVFACSDVLVNAKRAKHRNVVFAPHGVDVDLFSKVQTEQRPLPPIAQQLKRPIIGMYGLIDSRIDFDLLRTLARARPGWSFLFIGRNSGHEQEFAGIPNVTVTGPVRYEELPDWARSFDVGIMPYVPSPLIVNSNPLKLREFLAAGIPVVSVPVPAIGPYKDHVLIAETPEQWLTAIETAIADNSPHRARQRMASVASESWDGRAEAVLATVRTQFAASAS